MTSPKISSTLSKPSGWHEWIRTILSKAEDAHIEDLVDPDGPIPTQLIRPMLPVPEDVNEEYSETRVLTPEQAQDLRYGTDQYKDQLRVYEAKSTGRHSVVPEDPLKPI
jgi:galactose-1-phosphate uridylyltransferase